MQFVQCSRHSYGAATLKMACIRRRADRWQCQVRRKGFEPRSKTFSQRKDAERWGNLQERELDDLESRGESQRAVRCDLTLAEALERHSRLTRSGSGDRYIIGAIARRPIAALLLDRLERTQFICYRDERLLEVGPRTVARELWLIQRTFDMARKEWGFSTLENPVRDVAKPRQPRGRERRLQPGEEIGLIELAGLMQTVDLAAIIQFAIETAKLHQIPGGSAGDC